MLLKGVTELEQAPDRRAAAEMVLIRLCHVADMPPPGELVRRLQAQAAGLSGPPPGSPGPQDGGARAMAGGGSVAQAAPLETTAAAPRVASFRDVLALAAAEREVLLHGHLLHSVHLVRFAPPVIEIRPQPDAPRDLAAKLGALLQRATGTRWTIAISAATGEMTLAEQGNAADQARRGAAADHPLVRAILDAFPGARIEAVRDPGVDHYGLPSDNSLGEMELGESDAQNFTPDESDPGGLVEPADLMDVPLAEAAPFLMQTQ
jgi:DNA polymerase-3 subunit gamma/tau